MIEWSEVEEGVHHARVCGWPVIVERYEGHWIWAVRGDLGLVEIQLIAVPRGSDSTMIFEYPTCEDAKAGAEFQLPTITFMLVNDYLKTRLKVTDGDEVIYGEG